MSAREPNENARALATGTMAQPPGGSPEKEYQRRNPGAGGPPSQRQERGEKSNPATTRDDGGAAIPGSQNEDLKRPATQGESNA
jgi:hypothetical protein